MGLLGGLKDMMAGNGGDAERYARFAVEQQNAKQNSGLKFVRVVSAKSQVVQGQMYHLNIETEHESGTKQYEAKVWVKPWENHQSLESFTPVQT